MNKQEKSSQDSIIDGKRVLKATNVKNVHSIYLKLAENLTKIDLLHFVKIYNDRLCASNLLSENKKKEPITETGKEGVVGVQLLIDEENKIIQFYTITSSQKGYGRKIVEAVVDATPDDWFLAVPMDWSGGFWDKMIEKFPRIVVF
jgi:hypothetical protein